MAAPGGEAPADLQEAGGPAQAPPATATPASTGVCGFCQGDLASLKGHCAHRGARNLVASIEPVNRPGALLTAIWDCFMQYVSGAMASVMR